MEARQKYAADNYLFLLMTEGSIRCLWKLPPLHPQPWWFSSCVFFKSLLLLLWSCFEGEHFDLILGGWGRWGWADHVFTAVQTFIFHLPAFPPLFSTLGFGLGRTHLFSVIFWEENDSIFFSFWLKQPLAMSEWKVLFVQIIYLFITPALFWRPWGLGPDRFLNSPCI